MPFDQRYLLTITMVIVVCASLPLVAVGDESGDSSDGPVGTMGLDIAPDTDDETVYLLLSVDADDVAGYNAQLRYNSEILQLENIDGIELPDPVTNKNNDEGWVIFNSAESDGTDAPTLAELEFTIAGMPDEEILLEFVDDSTHINDAGDDNRDPKTYHASDNELEVQNLLLDIEQGDIDGEKQGSESDGSSEESSGGDSDGEDSSSDGSLNGEDSTLEQSPADDGWLSYAITGVVAAILISLGLFVRRQRR